MRATISRGSPFMVMGLLLGEGSGLAVPKIANGKRAFVVRALEVAAIGTAPPERIDADRLELAAVTVVGDGQPLRREAHPIAVADELAFPARHQIARRRSTRPAFAHRY